MRKDTSSSQICENAVPIESFNENHFFPLFIYEHVMMGI